MTELRTERLRLRPVATSDVAALVEHQTNPEVMRYVPGGARARAAVEALVAGSDAQWKASGHGLFALSHQETGELVGYCGLIVVAEAVELDMILAEEHWTQGIGTEAAAAVIEFARAKGIAKLVALPHDANVAAHRVCEKNGMSPNGSAKLQGVTCVRYELALS
ncbi:MAG: N-acetyltransferase [Planctomycetota bacterium]|nr:MAG: N-acetyltransferase [Planctomycetota bacterium]